MSRSSRHLAALAFCALVWGQVQAAHGQAGGVNLNTFQRPINPVPISNLAPAPSQTQNIGAFDIVINPSPGLMANPAALAAFNRAAAQWESKISDPISVIIAADLAALSPGVIGSTTSQFLQVTYSDGRTLMIADALGQPNNGVVAFLPTAAQFSATLPAPDGRARTLSGNMLATKANLKALKVPAATLDTAAGTTTDATIQFSSAFTFDYDNSNGVTAGQTDFETVAAHEIGHALGFTSIVDSISGDTVSATSGALSVAPMPLDLFRFDRTGGNNPTTTGTFTTNSRNLVPGADTITDDLTTEFRMSSGLNTAEFPAGGTDGRQASHWKDDALLNPGDPPSALIGLMDPTLGPGPGPAAIELVLASDFRALDLIGYDVIPEPTGLAALGVGVLGLMARRRRAS